MKLRYHIDDALWPYLRVGWVYAAALALFFLIVGMSILLEPWQAFVCDPIAAVIMIVSIQSRARLLMWRDRSVRRGQR